MRRLALASFGVLMACSSTDHPSNPVIDTGRDDTAASGDGSSLDSTVGDGGGKDSAAGDTRGDGSGDGSALDGGDGGDGGTKDSTLPDSPGIDVGPEVWPSDAPSFDALGPTVCPTTFPFGVTMVPVDYAHSTSGDLLAALTWDELTMAWTSTEGGTVVVHYGDRATRDASFGAGRTLPTSLGPFGPEKVAITADGLKMIFTTADHLKISQITRPTRADAFDPATATSTPFARLMASEGSPPRPVADLVISRDERLLVYTDLTATSGSSIRFSTHLGDGTYDAPRSIDAPALNMVGTAHRRPSGLSADGRTLFYFDEDDRGPKMAVRGLGASDFVSFYDINPVGVRPMSTEACDRLYVTISYAVDGGVAPTNIVHAP